MTNGEDGQTLRSSLTLGEAEQPITLRAIASTMLGGLVGVVVMAPLAVGVPVWLDLFTLDAPNVGLAIPGLPGGATLSIALFVLGGTLVLPLFFITTATYLPPLRPAYARGVTIATIFWPGFVIVFWPAADTPATAVFLVVSLVSHWLYGLTLGLVVQQLTGIPEHEV